ncbi:MAG: family 10 glycosylhydrolase [Melioribacteraceae bacterium]|nr:family 10 glycosylhydrolase [Melioribacteraceae bacterium]
MKKLVIVFLLCLITAKISAQEKTNKYEMRAAWVATVANIDWPSDKELSSGEQIIEMANQFEKLKEAGLNAVFFQIRAECDAFYQSDIEPWSFWLTGEQGLAPEPFFDPLKFAVSEAHKRGMELHAWFNPYRAIRIDDEYELAENHVAKLHPEWLLKVDKYIMLNPGLPAVKEYILSVVTDVISRYEIDGIHFDDYFYPYTQITNQDSLTFVKHSEGIKDIHDWRRFNINDLMAKIYKIVLAVKPRVKFGISPFGIVENKYAGTGGFESYNTLYCDPLNWLDNKIVDYITPQLYWEMDHSKAAYRKLLPWWNKVSSERHLYPGLFSSKMSAERYKGAKSEIGNQVRMNRTYNNVLGEVYFSAKSISENWSGLLDSLKQWYAVPAFPPAMPWKDNIDPMAVDSLKAENLEEGISLSWQIGQEAEDGDNAKFFAIYRFGEGEEVKTDSNENIIKIVPFNTQNYLDKSELENDKTYRYVVTALDKLYNESKNNQLKAVIYHSEK